MREKRGFEELEKDWVFLFLANHKGREIREDERERDKSVEPGGVYWFLLKPIIKLATYQFTFFLVSSVAFFHGQADHVCHQVQVAEIEPTEEETVAYTVQEQTEETKKDSDSEYNEEIIEEKDDVT
ncbi:hypothetical protein U1Q18_029460 [Sarracenia purpurea var. burkii]